MAYQPQGPVYNPPQQQIVTVSTGNPTVNAHYNSVGSRRTGWIQFVCGCICVLLGIVAIFINCYMSGGYFPIWAGLLFFITPGIAGIQAAKRRSSCSIVVFMVLSIFATLFAFCLFWVMLSAAIIDGTVTCRDLCEIDDFWCDETVCNHQKDYEACVAIDVILLFVALIEFVVSIISAAICCRGVCCKGSSKQTASYTTVSQNVPVGGGVVMQGPGAQYTVPPTAPAATLPYPQPAQPTQPAYPPAAGYPPAGGGYPQAGGYPPPQAADPNYPPQATYPEKVPLAFTESTAPSAPALDHPPTYEQSMGQ